MHHDEKPYFPARPVNWPGLHPANTTVRGLKFRNTLHQGRDVLQPHPRKYDRVPLENHRIDTSTPYPSLNGIHAPHCHVDDLYQKERLANPWCVSHCYILVCRYVSVFASPAATALNMNPGFQPSPGHVPATEVPPFSENSVRIYIGIVCSPMVNDWFECHLLQFTATCQKWLTTLGHRMVEVFE